MSAFDGTTLTDEDAELFRAALARSGDFKPALEDLLEALPRERADVAQLLLREGRGAWLCDLARGSGSVLFVGRALSGSALALARCGFDVTLVDATRAPLGFALARFAAYARTRVANAVVADPTRLPFASASFDVAVSEADARAETLAELARVAREELVVVAENRLGYKRSKGRRGEFHVPGPLEFALRALWPAPGARTLAGHRQALARAGCRVQRSFALYPHSGEFAQLAGLDGHGQLPRLFVGPRERENRLKLVGEALGLFPVLTPSFALIARKTAAVGARDTTRVQRILAELAEHTGESEPQVEHAVATRGNAVLWQTRPPGKGAGETRGRWTVKVPLGHHRGRLAQTHFERLQVLRARFPDVPVPEPLFAGRCDGVQVTCERRLAGLSGAQAPFAEPTWERTLAEVGERLAQLVVEPERRLDESSLSVLVDEKYELVARHVRDRATRAACAELYAAVRERLAGCTVPLVLQHADLRPKHLQVAADGGLLGFLDWGSSQLADLPYFDLLHLIAQGRKQAENAPPLRAWEIAREARNRTLGENAALESHATSLRLESDVCRALEDFYPILVAAQAERTWDYSRPGWVRAHWFA